jgi:superfamily II DNA or RNA helicase
MSHLPPADLLPITRDFLVEIGGWTTLRQAQAVVDAGRVIHVSFQAPVLSAHVVSDGRELVTRLKLGRKLSDVENLCTCRQAKEDGTICVHVVAAGLKWLAMRGQGVGGGEGSGRGAGVGGGGGVKVPVASVVSRVGGGNVSAAGQAAVAKPRVTWRCLVGAPGSQSAPLLEVRLLLPLSWPRVLREPRMRVILEGRVVGEGDFRPWDAVTRSGARVYAVGEEDEALLRWVEARHGGEVPGIFEVAMGDYHRFLRVLGGHEGVWVGKRQLVNVVALEGAGLAGNRPTLLLQGTESGELRLSLRRAATSPVGERFGMGEGSWRWDGAKGVLTEEFALPPLYAALEREAVVIGPEHVANFVERELPVLSRLLPMESDGSFERIRFETPVPEVCVTLEGGLPGMSLRLEAVYGAMRILLKPKRDSADAAAGWQVDGKEKLRYWKRNAEAEVAAVREVERAGFAPGHRSPENFFLSGEPLVGNFLANVLPRWRSQWRVEFGARMTNLLPRLDYVEPEITVSSGSGESNDWLGLDLELRAPGSGRVLEPSEVQRWLQTGLSHQRESGDRILLIPTKGWSELQEVLADCSVRQEPGRMKIGAKFAPFLCGAVEAQGWKLSGRSDWPPKTTHGKVLAPLDETLVARLRPYQVEGVNWLSGLAQRNLNGLLADEMGLGKTVQVLALIDRMYSMKEGDGRLEAGGGKREAAPSLIICPTSLVENWRTEAARFTPRRSVLVLHGADRHEHFSEIAKHDIVVTSYALLRRDLERYLEHEFLTVVLDEAQHIKNRSSLNAQSAKALKARHRFVLTGTPLENSLFDLWSIYDFLMPGYLGTAKDFKERYEVPIAREHDESAQSRLRLRMRPFFLRRTKEEVVRDLPAMLEQVTLCDLTGEQTEVYSKILDESRRKVFEGSGKSGQGKNRIAILTALLRLRQVACHLALLPESGEKTEWKEPSGKLDLCMELLDQAIDGGHRVLVFSQFVQLLHLVRAQLEKEQIEFCYLDGSTTERAEVVKRFQNTATIPVFLISLKAGGVGLNLTGADTVIHLDPWWNPAVEDQATARAHRIGQTRVVNSYKLIARGTVEEKIVALQEKKRELIAANTSSETLFVENLSEKELEGLFE